MKIMDNATAKEWIVNLLNEEIWPLVVEKSRFYADEGVLNPANIQQIASDTDLNFFEALGVLICKHTNALARMERKGLIHTPYARERMLDIIVYSLLALRHAESP